MVIHSCGKTKIDLSINMLYLKSPRDLPASSSHGFLSEEEGFRRVRCLRRRKGTIPRKRESRIFSRTPIRGDFFPVAVPVHGRFQARTGLRTGTPELGRAKVAAQGIAQRHHLLGRLPKDRQAGGAVGQAPLLDGLRGKRQGNPLQASRHRLEPPLGLRVEEPELPGVEKGGVEMIWDIEHAVERELPPDPPKKGQALRKESQARPLMPREPWAVDRKRAFRVGKQKPVDQKHPEDTLLRERPDRLPRAERGDLHAHFQEKAVARLAPGVQADALVLRVPALEREEGFAISPSCESVEDSRGPDPFPDLLRAEPAEEEVFRVVARKLEEEFPGGGEGLFPRSPGPQERKGKKPAQGGKTAGTASAHGKRSVP